MPFARDTGSIATPIGPVAVTAEGAAIVRVTIGASDAGTGSDLVRAALTQLAAWFADERDTFDLPLAPAATPRGQALRDAIAGVPLGETATYGDLARQHASSPRAIGQACARNPLPLIIPCHRVLGAGDRLGFYSAGDGAATKRWLLDLEARRTRLL